MFTKIEAFLLKIDTNSVTQQRAQLLQPLVDYMKDKKSKNEAIQLQFICTHNSRRSQFAQVWAQVIASYLRVNLKAFSGGMEVTACNERTVDSLERVGFKVESKESINPKYKLFYGEKEEPIILFSKRVDDEINPSRNFIAIMTCSHADENCPFVIGCENRIALPYDDPKVFDGSLEEKKIYDQRSLEIATELMFVFKKSEVI